MSDEDAYMALALCNAQGELHPLERGRHALGSGMDGKAYAANVGRPQPSVAREISAATVAEAVTDIGYGVLLAHFSHLVEIHAAPAWLWPALVAAMPATVQQTRELVARLSGVPKNLPEWAGDELGARLVAGTVPVRDINRIEKFVGQCSRGSPAKSSAGRYMCGASGGLRL
jgi:hypothetical protein